MRVYSPHIFFGRIEISGKMQYEKIDNTDLRDYHRIFCVIGGDQQFYE